jgi:hypothetical protein
MTGSSRGLVPRRSGESNEQCLELSMLLNGEYEVVDLATEEEARQHARKLLWEPLFGQN